MNSINIIISKKVLGINSINLVSAMLFGRNVIHQIPKRRLIKGLRRKVPRFLFL